MKKVIIFAMVLCCHLPMNAQRFDDYFEDKTLRIDYISTEMLRGRRSVWMVWYRCLDGQGADRGWQNFHLRATARSSFETVSHNK